MKSVLMLALIVMTHASTAFASDSMWLVCNSKSFLISAFEHRKGADTRETDITLIYGGHVAKGVLSENSNKVVLSSPTLQIEGEMTIDFRKMKMTLDGPIYISGNRFDIEETFNCVDKTQLSAPGSSGH